jgi:16S rRNA (guanine527-N7)-methyltransferase
VFHVKHGGGEIDAGSRERLDQFAEILLRWNRRINLISRADEQHLWPRHILDCLQLVPLLPAQPASLVDIGSGAGFPGMVLALITGWHVHLIEADHRKAAFLREVARDTGATVAVYASRAESVKIGPVAVVTARALGSISTLLDLAAPFLLRDGICLFPKGRGCDPELASAQSAWRMTVERFPSKTDSSATVLRLSEIRRAP